MYKRSNVSTKKKVVLGFLKGRDTFACLPTGYGKSLVLRPLLDTRETIPSIAGERMRDRKLVGSRQRSLSSRFILPRRERPLLAGKSLLGQGVKKIDNLEFFFKLYRNFQKHLQEKLFYFAI